MTASAGTDVDPHWQLDLGVAGLPIKYVLIIGRVEKLTAVHGPGIWVSVGESPDPQANTNCNTASFDITSGREQPCNLPGRYVTITKPGTDQLVLAGVSVFMDCDSPLLPWDTIVGLPATMNLNATLTVDIPLATTIETNVGVEVCGQLEVQFTNLPSFCTWTDPTLTCTPTLDAHAGLHNFEIKQKALEYPLSAKTTTALIEVIGLAVTEPIQVELVPEEFVQGNTPPRFESSVASPLEVIKTLNETAWSYSLPRVVDTDEDDTVTVSASLGFAATFIELEESDLAFKIQDLSSELVTEGSYNLKVTLDDGKDETTYSVVLIVLPANFTSAFAEELGDSTRNSTNSSFSAENEEEDQKYTNLPETEAEAVRAEEKKQIEVSVKKYRTSQINESSKALLDQGDPSDRNYTEPVYPKPHISKFT